MKKFTAIFLIALLFISHFHEAYAVSRLRAAALTEAEIGAEAEPAKDSGGFQADPTGLAKACLSSLMDAIPPDFCWKSGSDWGTIPTGCPNGWFRSLALCYEYCRSGYSFTLGVCWEDCPSGYSNTGPTCFKWWKALIWRKSYMSSSLTNFSDRIPCPDGMYRSGALCYRDCNKIGMVNCGIGACSASSGSCATSIISMALDTLSGIATGVATILTLGASTPATTAAKAATKAAAEKAGPMAMKAAFNALKSKLTGEFAKVIKDRAIALAKSTGKKFIKMVGENLAQSAIETYVGLFCQPIIDSIIGKTTAASAPPNATELLVNTLDIFGVQDLVKGCSNTKQDGGLDCAKAALGTLSTFDPTGLLTIAAAFMHPKCNGV